MPGPRGEANLASQQRIVRTAGRGANTLRGMARMIPKTPDTDSPGSERYVFGRLRDGLPDAITVLHARRFVLPATNRRAEQEGELDFLVVDPSRGMLGLEVKGGGVSREQDGWTSTGRDGCAHPISDPGRQAQGAVYAIARYLSRPGAPRSGAAATPYGWGVVFPDVDVRRDLGPDLPRSRVIDRLDLADPARSVARMFDAQKLDGPPLSREAFEALIGQLAPCFHLAPSLEGRLRDEAEALVRLTEEQIRILRALERQPRLAIEGAAGTGKTVLAVERARRLAAEGKRVLLLCFNRPLADALGRDAKGFEVDTFHGLCRVLAEKAGIDFSVPDSQNAAQRFWETEAPEKLLDALARLPDARWDALIVDEGQDFRANWWPVIDELFREPKAGTLSVFFDPRQNLYGGGPPADLATHPYVLAWNCRNTARIARWCAERVNATAELHPDAPEGEPVEEIHCATEADAVDAVRRLLHHYVVEGRLSADRVVVLSTHNTSRSVLTHHRNLAGLALVPFEEKRTANQVRFASLQRFKGLEADVVILVDVEPGERTSSPTHLYVGASRARHRLAVVINEAGRPKGASGG